MASWGDRADLLHMVIALSQLTHLAYDCTKKTHSLVASLWCHAARSFLWIYALLCAAADAGYFCSHALLCAAAAQEEEEPLPARQVIRTSVKSLWINSSFLAKRLFLNTFYAHTRIDIFFHRYLFIYFVLFAITNIFIITLHGMIMVMTHHLLSLLQYFQGILWDDVKWFPWLLDGMSCGLTTLCIFCIRYM